jgi:hypothetical protein
MSCSSQAWRTPFWSHKIHKISPLNPPKLLIFGKSKEGALIYILTEAIYFPLSFAWGPLCLGLPCVPRPWFVYLVSCYLLFDSIVLYLGASNSVVDACPKIVKAGSALRNPLVESELGLCGRSLHQRLGWAFVALVRPLWQPHLSNVDVLPLKRKKLWELHPCLRVLHSRLPLSFIDFIYCILFSLLVII